MRFARPLTVLATTAVAAAALAGCTTSTVVEGSEVVVAVAEPFTSLNPNTSYGRSSTTNGDVAHLTGSGFAYLDDHGAEVADPSFGVAEIVAEDPLTVRYAVDPGARWSDGVPVDAADLVLAWAADSGALSTPDFDDRPYVDPETGRYTDEFPDDVVFFDGAIGAGLERVTQPPQIASDRRTVFLHFDEYAANWRTALVPIVPAHIVARRVLHLEEDASATDAKLALVAALLGGDAVPGGAAGDAPPDPVATAAIARFWNDAYHLDPDAAPDADLLVASGPYVVEQATADEVVLAANLEYRGARQPVFETIRLRYSPDPLETAELLRRGVVDIASPEPTAEVVAALRSIDGVTVVTGTEGRFEHIDLMSMDGRSRVFDDVRVRRAFLHVLPRQRIVDEVVAPVQPDAAVLDSFVLLPHADGYQETVESNGSRGYRAPDAEEARRLLADAGVANPRVCILYDPANPRRVAEFRIIKEAAAEAGFQVTDCSSTDWRGLLGVAGAYDAALFAWDTTRLGPAAVSAVFRSDSALANFNRYANPEVDALADELASPAGEGREAELLAEIDAHLWADAYGAPLFAYPTVTAVSDDVAGVTRSPLARSVFWNAWEWEPADAAR